MNIATIILIHAIRLWKQWKAEHPNDPTLTDQQVFDLLRTDGEEIVATAEAMIAAHPKA